MATKVVKKELNTDEIKEFGEDAATAINELLGLYGYDSDNKRSELSVKFHRNSCKKIANISQKLMESKRQLCNTHDDNESLRSSKINDFSSVSSDKDSSSRENSKSPMLHSLAAGGIVVADQQENNCSWCHQTIGPQSTEILGISQGTKFCSENCFSYWRRASFKRAKTCDFCKNVRNAVSYVDFNDGATQLQFCSDKCLNQYKMQIFCRETQAHLELNPHLKEKIDSSELITPDLWLKNCRSRSPSPDVSRSPSPTSLSSLVGDKSNITVPKIIITQSQPSSSATVISTSVNLSRDNIIDASKKPLINVLPSSKLLSRNMFHHKNLRKRRSSARLASSSCSNNINSKQNHNPNGNNSTSERIINTNFPPDLRAKIHSQINGNTNIPKIIQPSNFNNRPPPPPPFQFMQRPPLNIFKFRPPFPIQRMSVPLSPSNHQQPHQHQSDEHNHQLPPLNSLVPPPVVLVPYPIILPIVIPIPLPLEAFWKAYQKKEPEHATSSSATAEVSMNNNEEINGNGNNNSKNNESHIAETLRVVAKQDHDEGNDQPLDYTITTTTTSTTTTNTKSKSPAEHSDNKIMNNDDIEINSISINSDFRNICVENSSTGNNVEQRLPKFKITRLNSKRIFSKDFSESSRPLRKRKRVMAEANNFDDNDSQ